MAHLVRVGVLDAATVVRDGVVVHGRSRRNVNHLVEAAAGGLFVKQGVGPGRSASVRAEAQTYRLLAGVPRLARYLAPVRHLEPGDGDVGPVLVLGAVAGAASLREHHRRTGRLPLLAARDLGRALGLLHAAEADPAAARPDTGAAEVAALVRPPLAAVEGMSRGGRSVLAMVQAAPGARALLDDVVAGWRPAGLVHGDVRWDNVLVAPRTPGARVSRVVLVDWELARLGDPAWDLGCAWGEYLAAWAASLGAAPGARPAAAPRTTGVPLDRVRTCARGLWHAYLSTRADVDDVAALRLRAVRYAGCRLVQTAFERTLRTSVLPSDSVVAAQLGLNTVARPLDTATHLLGLDLAGAP